MAENERKEQLETSASTPNSTGGADADAGPKAPKDRNCPFCGQAFTSSSLGRHLDLYIKPKNPKPPDGVHDVNEIRKIRGSITRRQPRTSLVKGKEDSHQGDGSSWSSTAPNKSAKMDTNFTDGDRVNSPINGKDEGLHTWLNYPNWQATGVINNLPARSPSRNQTSTPTGQAQRLQEMRRDTAGNRIERPEYGSGDIWKLQESAEVGRAAEMALREVLGSLQAARKKAEPRKLFEEFDFCTLSFPGLCLALLPPPSTLFSSTPFPAAHTWSLTPPGEKQFDAMNRMLFERVTAVRNGVRDNVPESAVFRHQVHLQGAWEHWQLMSENDKCASWNLELSRAFVREREKKQNLETDLRVAQQRVRHIEAEYERMSRCQLPREYLLHPPNTIDLSPEVMKEMKQTDQNSKASEADYDADALISKWKATVKATARPAKPPPAQPSYSESTMNQLKSDIIMNSSVWGVGGPLPRGEEANGSNNDQSNVSYETPQYPGTVLSADDGTEEMDGDADADGEAEDDYANQAALTKLRNTNQSTYESSLSSAFNINGKRPLAPTPPNGRNIGPRLHREQPKT